MKKFFYYFICVFFFISCQGSKSVDAVDEVVYNVPKYTEPNWLEVDNGQCHQDQWMRVPSTMLRSDLIARLVDAYNTDVVWHSVGSDMECFWRWDVFTDSSMVEMDLSIIRDDKTRQMASDLCLTTAHSQHDESINPNDEMDKYLSFISSSYHISTFIDLDTLSEDAYWEAVKKSNWVSNWEDLFRKRGLSDKKHMSFLRHAMDTASTFNARCVYALEYAHSSEDGPYFEEGIPYLVKFLTVGRYSPLLPEMWQTWRAMQSSHMGASKDSDIPNAEYNQLRLIACYTMLCHIQDHPDDWLAINNFLVTSYEDNIGRYGSYSFGNQSAIEQLQCFPEHYKDIFERDND